MLLLLFRSLDSGVIPPGQQGKHNIDLGATDNRVKSLGAVDNQAKTLTATDRQTRTLTARP